MSNELLRWRKESKKVNPLLWERLAVMIGTSPGYLNLIAYGKRKPSAKRAKAIESATLLITEVNPVTKESLLF